MYKAATTLKSKANVSLCLLLRVWRCEVEGTRSSCLPLRQALLSLFALPWSNVQSMHAAAKAIFEGTDGKLGDGMSFSEADTTKHRSGTDIVFTGLSYIADDEGHHYILQHSSCRARQYKQIAQPCRVCISRDGAGDSCRFRDVRAVPVTPLMKHSARDESKSKPMSSSRNDELHDVCVWPPRDGRQAHCVFLSSNAPTEEAQLPQHTDLNRAMDESNRSSLLSAVAHSLLPIMLQAREIAQMPRCIRRERDLQYRILCDSCTTGIFASSFMCTLCGQELCRACHLKLAQQSTHAHHLVNRPDYLMYCASARNRTDASRGRHFANDFIPITRFSLDELEDETTAMQAAALCNYEASEKSDGETTESSRHTEPNSSSFLEDEEDLTEGEASTLATSSESSALKRLTKLVCMPWQPASFGEDDDERLRTPQDIWIPSMLTDALLEESHRSVPMTEVDFWMPDESRYGKSPVYHDPVEDTKNLEEMAQGLSDEVKYSSFQCSSFNSIVEDAIPTAASDDGLFNTDTGNVSNGDARHSFRKGKEISPTPPLDTDASFSQLPSHAVVFHTAADLTEDTFLQTWSKGEPLVVHQVETLRTWDPLSFQDRYGDEVCEIVRCDSQPPALPPWAYRRKVLADPHYSKVVRVRDFFATFGMTQEMRAKKLGRGIWKLKDWPPSTEFRTSFPDIYEDFNAAVPMADYTRRDGCKNLSALFPRNANGPDLGPKMYNAWAGQHTKGKKGTTRLHMDIADAVNIMLYASEVGEAIGAQWDIFRAEDAQKIRDFLWELEGNTEHKSDPIHTQLHYLDDELLRRLYECKGVYSWRIIQRPSQAIFIPAGCAHQVCNLSDCIKVAVDFLSIQNVERCFRLTEEFAALATEKSKSWKEDVLQLRAQLWYAWKTCSQIGPPPSERDLQRFITERETKKGQAQKRERGPRKLLLSKRKHQASEDPSRDEVAPTISVSIIKSKAFTRSDRSSKSRYVSPALADAAYLESNAAQRSSTFDTSSSVTSVEGEARDTQEVEQMLGSKDEEDL